MWKVGRLPILIADTCNSNCCTPELDSLRDFSQNNGIKKCALPLKWEFILLPALTC